LACIYVFTYIVFWTLLCFFVSAWQKPDAVILMALVTVWVSSSVIVPASARLAIDKAVELPSGSDILMLQRQAVNGAWDLPREVTMDAFFKQHPEWSDYEQVEGAFEWQWYYAFQQVGDQQAEPVSTAYRTGRLQRDFYADWAALLAPPSLLERSLQSLAGTDLKASIAYEDRVRAYHVELRAFYYPKFFKNEVFDKDLLKELPKFVADD
jgi:ABC-2 type transport system permease protein